MIWMHGAVLFVLGLFSLSLIEYIHHAHAGHRGWFGKKLLGAHLAHHRDPLEGGVAYLEKVRQRMPLVLVSTVVLGVPLLLLTSTTTAAWVMAGIVAGYFYSEWFHHAIHHRSPRNAFERFMWRYHYIHHFYSAANNIGFTSPLWDVIFRTAQWEASIIVPAGRVKEFVHELPGVSVKGAREEHLPP